jgi:hypothetical protein
MDKKKGTTHVSKDLIGDAAENAKKGERNT